MAHGHIGKSLFNQGKFDEALIHLDRQLELASYLKNVHPMAYSDVYYHKALIFSAKGRLEDAAEQYRKSLEVDNNSALVHYLLANILAKQEVECDPDGGILLIDFKANFPICSMTASSNLPFARISTPCDNKHPSKPSGEHSSGNSPVRAAGQDELTPRRFALVKK